MNNEIVISNINPQDIIINEGGGAYGVTNVYVNGVDVTVGNIAYVIVPTKVSELINDKGYITQEQDPTVPYYVKQIKLSDINNWNNKQNELVSGVNIKTINNNSILGEGNLVVSTDYTSGTGIEITEENVINNTITDYEDLNNLPTIPTATSELLNDSGYVTSEELSNVAFSGSYNDLSDTPDLGEYATLDTEDLINYYTKEYLFGLLPKVTSTGSIINLNNTYSSQLKLDLGATELTQDSTPSPSSPQDIHTISGSNKVVVCGKNLFDAQNVVYVNGKILNDSGVETSDSGGGYTKMYIPVEPNTQYTISGLPSAGTKRIYYFNNSKTFISRTSGISGTSRTITTPSNCYYLDIQYSTVGNDFNTYMVCKGTSTEYEPYISQEADIDLGDIEYCKIGTYADRIFKNVSGDVDYSSEREDGAWYIKKNIGKVVLDGTEANWYVSGDDSVLAITDSLGNASKTYSNYFNGVTTTNLWGDIKFGGSNQNLIFYKGISENTNLEGWKSWLSSHNTIVNYILSTPTYKPITGTLANQLENAYNNLTNYNPQTNISQVNADLPFTITATTLKDISNL